MGNTAQLFPWTCPKGHEYRANLKRMGRVKPSLTTNALSYMKILIMDKPWCRACTGINNITIGLGGVVPWRKLHPMAMPRHILPDKFPARKDISFWIPGSLEGASNQSQELPCVHIYWDCTKTQVLLMRTMNFDLVRLASNEPCPPHDSPCPGRQLSNSRDC